MLSVIWTKAKAFFTWFWHWITVIVGIIAAGIATVFDQLDQLTGIDFSAFISPTRAAQIVAGVALTKAVVSIVSAVRAKV